MISERMGQFESDNLISYYAGPVKISINGWNELITLSVKKKKWEFLLKECLQTAIEAWEIDDSNELIYKELSISIKYNFKNIKLYIENSIIFL